MSEGADSSTASGDAGTSSPQDVIDATEEEGASAQKAVRVKEYWVEMVMFLKANYKFIPAYKDIPQIDSRDIRKCLPAKFDRTNEDLLRAEMALDPLSNEAPPTAANIDLGA